MVNAAISSAATSGSSCSQTMTTAVAAGSPAPAMLTTYRRDGSAHTVPVWYRWTGEAFEVVIAKGDVKLRHLARDPHCVLVVFGNVRPFRGVERCAGWPTWLRATSPRCGRLSPAAISA